jgi:hypothetical protein
MTTGRINQVTFLVFLPARAKKTHPSTFPLPPVIFFPGADRSLARKVPYKAVRATQKPERRNTIGGPPRPNEEKKHTKALRRATQALFFSKIVRYESSVQSEKPKGSSFEAQFHWIISYFSQVASHRAAQRSHRSQSGMERDTEGHAAKASKDAPAETSYCTALYQAHK